MLSVMAWNLWFGGQSVAGEALTETDGGCWSTTLTYEVQIDGRGIDRGAEHADGVQRRATASSGCSNVHDARPSPPPVQVPALPLLLLTATVQTPGSVASCAGAEAEPTHARSGASRRWTMVNSIGSVAVCTLSLTM